MFFLSGACETSGFLKIVYFILELVKIVFIIVPIGLILMIVIDLLKSIMSDSETMKKNLRMSIRRIILCVVIFFLPTIVNLFVGIISDAGIKIKYSECITNAKVSKIKEYEAIEKKNKKNS